MNQQISSSVLSGSASATQGQFIINKSGRYFLSTDIFAVPGRSNLACIYINVSDVVLDLGGKTLTLSTTSNQKNSAAIEIASGKSSITIMNGTINGYNSLVYTSTGIKFNSDVSNVLLDNVSVINTGHEGISFDSNCSNIMINNSHTYNIGARAGSLGRGLYLNSCNDVTIADSTFNKTITKSGSNAPSYGIHAQSCNNILMNRVQVTHTTCITGVIRGIYLDACTGALCNDVTILRSTSGSNAAPIIAGFDLSNCSGGSFTNCSSYNNLSTSSTTTTYGFRIGSSSNNNAFTNCEAKGNLGNGTTCGFQINNSHFNTLQNCSSISNGGASRITYGFQSGIDVTTTCSGTSFKSCKANGNTGTNLAYGIASRGGTSTSIQNCEIKANTAGSIAYGIALQGNSLRNVIEYNSIYSNIGQATGQYGFKDFASDCTSMLRGNVSFGHGATFSGGNASLTDTGSMNYMLSYSEAAGQMNIQFLIKEGDIGNMNAFEIGSNS